LVDLLCSLGSCKIFDNGQFEAYLIAASIP